MTLMGKIEEMETRLKTLKTRIDIVKVYQISLKDHRMEILQRKQFLVFQAKMGLLS